MRTKAHDDMACRVGKKQKTKKIVVKQRENQVSQNTKVYKRENLQDFHLKAKWRNLEVKLGFFWQSGFLW